LRCHSANPVEEIGFFKCRLSAATSADGLAVVLGRKLNRKIDMTNHKSVPTPKDNLFRSETKSGNGTAAQLAEEELERVVGGYIGETEKNLS
jgi:hypothetical protein